MAWTKTDPIQVQSASPIYDGRFTDIARPAKVSSIVRNDKTWSFTNPVYAVQYITGDWCLVDTGDIEVSSVLPAQSVDVNGYVINGSMKNPVPGGKQGMHQSQFDSGINPITVDDETWDAALTASFPIALTAKDSFLSATSRVSSDINNWRGAVAGKDPILQSVDVLTCSEQAPTKTQLRPAVTDRTGKKYDSADINLDLLPSLDTTGFTFSNYTGWDGYDPGDNEFAYFERGSSKLFPVWCNDFTGRNIHPMSHMEDYHEQVADFFSEAYLMLCTDFSNTEKQQLAINLCQIGIDYYETGLQSASVDSSWWTTPIIVTGHLMGNSEMRNCFASGSMLKVSRDMLDFYYWADRIDSGDAYPSAYITPGETYAGYKVYFRNNLALGREHEQLRPDEWTPITVSGDESWKDDNYRTTSDTAPHVGMILAEQAVGLQSYHNHPSTFEMMTRWMVDADPEADKAILDTYYNAPTDTYPPSLAVKSSRITFIDEMWTEHWDNYIWPADGGTTTRGGV